MVISGGSGVAYYRCEAHSKRGTCRNGLSVKEGVVRASLLDELRHRPNLEYLAMTRGVKNVYGVTLSSAQVEEINRRKLPGVKGVSLRSVANVHAGAVAAIQRTDGAMRLNVHAHVLALDGVYVRDGPEGTLAFHALPAPTRTEVTEVARRTAARVERILLARGQASSGPGRSKSVTG